VEDRELEQGDSNGYKGATGKKEEEYQMFHSIVG
jgi:hypothetical protein